MKVLMNNRQNNYWTDKFCIKPNFHIIFLPVCFQLFKMSFLWVLWQLSHQSVIMWFFGCFPPDGHPTPVVWWIKDGEFLDLSSANKFQIVGSGNLVISSVQKSDAGWYICSARNLAGTRETDPTEIKITGKLGYKK